MTTIAITTENPSDATTATTTPAPGCLHWAHVSDGLWVCSTPEAFMGTVEFIDGGFETSDERGEWIGRSHSLAGAKQLLTAPKSQPRPVLRWGPSRTALTLGWAAVAITAAATVGIATQFFA